MSSPRRLHWALLNLLTMDALLMAAPRVHAAGVDSQPGCEGAWSSGTCWINFISNPPSQTPPVDGEVVSILQLSTITLDVSANLASFNVLGTFNHPLGSIITDDVTVASNPGAPATYNLSGGLLNIASSRAIAFSVAGTFNQSGGAVISAQGASVGTLPSLGTATYNLTDGDFQVGGLEIASAVNGTFNQSGGAASIAGPLIVGGPFDPAPVPGGVGALNIRGGTFNVSDTLGFGMVVGGIGTGQVNQSDGTVNVDSGGPAGGLVLGRSAGGSGTYALSGGELNVNQAAIAGPDAFMIVGQSGSGVFTQTLGHTQIEGTLTLGANAGSSGTVNLSGSGSASLLEAHNEILQNGVFNQTGGHNEIDTNTAGPGGGQLAVFGNGIYNLSAGFSNDSLLKVEDRELIQGGAFNQTGGTNQMDGALAVFGGGSYNLGGVGSALTVGDDLTVTNSQFTQTGGSASVNGGLTVDGNGTGQGSYSLGGLGTLAAAGGEVIGDGGTGTFAHSAGVNSTPGDLVLGNSTTGQGSYSLSGTGALSVGGNVIVGVSGTGVFDQSGGSANVSGQLRVGSAANGGNGTYSLSAGTLDVTGDTLIGAPNVLVTDPSPPALTVANSTGAFKQSAGTVSLTGNLNLGARGSYSLIDGSLQVSGNEWVGTTSTAGSLTQGGGTNTVNGTLVVGAGGSGAYLLNAGTLQATNEVIGQTTGTITNTGVVASIPSSGMGVMTQSGGVNTITDVLTIGAGGSATYNLDGGIINAGTPETEGLVNNATLNVQGVSQITGNVLNKTTGTITVTNATLNVTGSITNFGTITLDPSKLTVQDLTIGATGVMTAAAGDALAVLGDFINDSVQNTLWNTDGAELDFVGGGTHTFGLAGRDSSGFADNFGWGLLDLGGGDLLDLTAGSGDALYVDVLDGLQFAGNTITNIEGTDGLFLYYNAADNPLLQGNYALEGGGELVALGGSPGGGGTGGDGGGGSSGGGGDNGGGSPGGGGDTGGGGGATAVPEPSVLALLLTSLCSLAAMALMRRPRLRAQAAAVPLSGR